MLIGKCFILLFMNICELEFVDDIGSSTIVNLKIWLCVLAMMLKMGKIQIWGKKPIRTSKSKGETNEVWTNR